MIDKLQYILAHYKELGHGVDWRVDWVRWNWLDLAKAVSGGHKPFADLIVFYEPGEEITLDEYFLRLQHMKATLSAMPKQSGLEWWVVPLEYPRLVYGKKENYEAYLSARQLQEKGYYFESQALYGLAFGYSADKISAFLIRLEESGFRGQHADLSTLPRLFSVRPSA